MSLTIAVPRGALLGETLDLLDRLGVDTAEVRANDRKLLFEDAGLVTMRPSDVPTYVEAGAADLGITGKDVLAEHPERDVYELLDLGFGPCRMVFATVAGEDRAAEALRRLGVMRVATKYPRIAARLLRAHGPPGRDRRGQGLRRAGAADRARGRDRRPHRDRHDAARERARDPRGDRGLDRAADRQPGGPQAQGGRDRRRASPGSVARRSCTARDGRGARRGGARWACPAGTSVARRRAARSSPRSATAATPRCSSTSGASAAASAAAGRRGSSRPRWRARPRRARGAGGGDRERARGRARRASSRGRGGAARRARPCGCARCPVDARGDLRPGRPQPVSRPPSSWAP